MYHLLNVLKVPVQLELYAFILWSIAIGLVSSVVGFVAYEYYQRKLLYARDEALRAIRISAKDERGIISGFLANFGNAFSQDVGQAVKNEVISQFSTTIIPEVVTSINTLNERYKKLVTVLTTLGQEVETLGGSQIFIRNCTSLKARITHFNVEDVTITQFKQFLEDTLTELKIGNVPKSKVELKKKLDQVDSETLQYCLERLVQINLNDRVTGIFNLTTD